MSWLVDNANLVFILLGLAFIGFATAWWLDQRVKRYAYAAAGALLLIVLFWLLTRTVVTDREQLRRNVDAMADAVVAQDADALFKHVAKDFSYKGMKRKELYDRVARAIKLHKVKTAYISDFTPIELARAQRKAKASFRVRVDDQGDAVVFFARCEADFVLEQDDWKLQGIEFFNAVVDQDRPIAIPLP